MALATRKWKKAHVSAVLEHGHPPSVLALEAPAQTNYRRAEVCEPDWLHHPSQCEWAPGTLIRTDSTEETLVTSLPPQRANSGITTEMKARKLQTCPECLQISLKGKQVTEKQPAWTDELWTLPNFVGEGPYAWVQSISKPLTSSTDVRRKPSALTRAPWAMVWDGRINQTDCSHIVPCTGKSSFCQNAS